MKFDGNTTTLHIQANWIVPVAVTAFLIAASLWLLISLVYYGIQTNKWKKMKLSHYDKLNTGLVYSAVVICAVFCLVRLIINLIYMNVGFGDEMKSETCNSVFDTMGVMYALVILSTYIFLWLRQRTFYTNRMLNVNYTKTAKFFSAVSIIVITLCSLCVILFTTLADDHFSSPDGCHYKPDKSLIIGYYMSLAFVILLGNATLFGLFAHGLRKAKDYSSKPPTEVGRGSTDIRANGKSSESTKQQTQVTDSTAKVEIGKSSVSTLSHKTPIPTSTLVKTVLKKTLILAVVSVLCDITLLILLYFSPIHRRLVTLAFNVNAFLNVLFLVLSFVQYKKMLFSPFYSKLT